VDDELEVIREQMEEKRASLADKIEALETQVRETVQTASDTVSSAVEGAKEVVSSVTEGTKDVIEKVSETVDAVKEKLSVRRYVEHYPWASVGVSVAAGFCLAQLLPAHRRTSGDRSEALPPASSGGYSSGSSAASMYQSPASEPPRRQESTHGALSGVMSKAAGTVGGLALGTLMSAIKGLVTHSLPQQWQNELTRLVDDVTTQVGGKVMQGNPLEELLSGLSQDGDPNRAGHGASSGQPPGQGTRT